MLSLRLLYINDITKDISSDIRLFAENCILYCVIRSQSDCIALHADIDRLHSWATTWQMQFNSSKCHILSISHKRNPGLSSYYLGTDQLSSVDSYPYLGITVSSDLRWDKHVSALIKATRHLISFVVTSMVVPQKVKSLAYTCLIRPMLEYATAAWDPYRAKDINKLDLSLIHI